MTATATPSTLTYEQAHAVLSSPRVHRAHLVDAVLLGVESFNAHGHLQGQESAALRVLFSSVESLCVRFALFRHGNREAMCQYSYDPERMASPLLCLTDSQSQPCGQSNLTLTLQPLMDQALAAMEAQMWERVAR